MALAKLTIEINNYLDLIVTTEDRFGGTVEHRGSAAWRFYWSIEDSLRTFDGTIEDVRNEYVQRLLNERLSNTEIGERLGVSRRSVQKWKNSLNKAVKREPVMRHYTRRERELALLLLEANGDDARKTSYITGIDARTLRRWKSEVPQTVNMNGEQEASEEVDIVGVNVDLVCSQVALHSSGECDSCLAVRPGSF